MRLLRSIPVMLVVLAACGDDGGGSSIDAPRSIDGAGSGSDAGTGFTPGTDVNNPTQLGIGDTGTGSLAVGNTLHFWTFLPPSSGDFVIQLGGSLHAQVDWCDQAVSAQGCACIFGPPSTCCDIVTAGACTVSMPGLTAGTATSMVTWNRGPDPITYTISVVAAP